MSQGTEWKPWGVSKGRWLAMGAWTQMRGPRHLHLHQSGGAAGVGVLLGFESTELMSSCVWELLEGRVEPYASLHCPARHLGHSQETSTLPSCFGHVPYP